MAAQVTETTNEGLKRGYKVIVPAADIEEKVTSRLTEVARTARMPGFRPGRVPVSLLRKTYGNAVMGEVLEATVNESSQSALADKDFRPVTQPKIEIEKFEEGADLEYTMELEIFPDISLADFAKLKLERFKVPATDEQIDGAIEQMANSRKESKPITDARKIANGDVAIIDFVGRVDGEEFAGGKAEGYSLELGSGAFIPGFEEQIVGYDAGDKFDVNVTFPENYTETLAGKEAVFEVTLHEIHESIPAEINDELAKSMGAESVEDLKRQVKEAQEMEMGAFTKMRLKRDLLDLLDNEHKFELPQGMIQSEFDAIWEQFTHQREHHPDQIDPDDQDKSDEELQTQYREIAERRVRLGLLLAEIGRVNEITVSPEELNRALMQEAQRHPGQEKEVLDYFKNNPEAMQSLQSPVLEDKVIDFIVELADVTDKDVTIEELMAEATESAVKSSESPDSGEKKKKSSAKKKASAKGKAKKATAKK